MNLKEYSCNNTSTIFDKNKYYLKQDVDSELSSIKVSIIKKIIGNISPVAETNEDNLRLENLKTHIEVVKKLYNDLVYVANNIDRFESSVITAAKESIEFLNFLKYDIGELTYLEDNNE